MNIDEGVYNISICIINWVVIVLCENIILVVVMVICHLVANFSPLTFVRCILTPFVVVAFVLLWSTDNQVQE